MLKVNKLLPVFSSSNYIGCYEFVNIIGNVTWEYKILTIK